MSDTKSSPYHGLITLAGLALLAGVGILAAAIGLTWQPENTNQLVIAGAAVCGGGFALLALTLGLFVGIGLYRRLTADLHGGAQRGPSLTLPAPADSPSLPALPGSYYREVLPPMLADPEGGEWRTAGPGSYDLWEDDGPARPAQAAPRAR